MTKYIVIHVFLVPILTYFTIKLYPLIENYFIFETPQKYSSVYCNGNNHTDRRCRFTNLCFKSDTKDFLFGYDDNSIISGVPFDRFSPALLDLSSVYSHNKFYFNYVEIPVYELFQTLSKDYEIIEIKGKTLIFGRFKPDNLMHLFHDDVIPVYFTLNEIGWNNVENLFMADHSPPYSDSSLKFSRSIYQSLFSQMNIYSQNQVKNNEIYCFEEAYVGLSKATLWYQYGFHSPQSPIQTSQYEKQLIAKIIQRFTNHLIPKKQCRDYVLLISRKNTRLILNENEILIIISEITRLPIIRLRIEEYSDINEIIAKIMCAKIIIGMHGSALILSLFLQSDSALIELFPFAINPDHYTPYKTLIQLKNINIIYEKWRNIDINATVTHKNYPKEWGGIEHLSQEEQQNLILNNGDVPPHLCCSDPQWLYRIYQDTIVDGNAFGVILKKVMNQISLHENTEINHKRLSPGFVQNPHCIKTLHENSMLFVIKWQKPWNIQFLQNRFKQIQYNLIIQKLSSLSATTVTTIQTEHTIRGKPQDVHNIWIKCSVDDIEGPFIAEPIVC